MRKMVSVYNFFIMCLGLRVVRIGDSSVSQSRFDAYARVVLL